MLVVSLPSSSFSIACSTNVNVTPVSVPPDAIQPRNAEDVEVFGGSEQPTRPNLKSVMLTVPVEGTPRDMTEGLREKAGEAGCDAIMLRVEPGTADCIYYERE